MLAKRTVLLSILLSWNLFAQVPDHWQQAFQQVYLKLENLQSVLDDKLNGSTNGTLFSQDLFLANSSRGHELIDPATRPSLLASIDSTLSAFSGIGLKAVSITVQYPILVKNFPNEAEYRQFYEKIAQKVHEKGFTVLVACQSAFIDSSLGEANLVRDVQNWYEQLSDKRYRHEKAQMLQTIINILSPDYLTVEMEPQTQKLNLKNRVNFDSDSVVGHVNFFLKHLKRNKTLIGAGAGTWEQFEYLQKLSSCTSIDYIDFHIYPLHLNYFDDIVFKIASLSQQYNKELIIGEAWCYKATYQELLDINETVATSAEIFSRDMFDYWVPIDSMFIKAVVSLSHLSKVKLTSFYWPTLLFAYLTYSPSYDSLSFTERLHKGQQAGFENLLHKQLSPTGEYLRDIIKKDHTTFAAKEHGDAPSFSLSQNYPNPFNPLATCRFYLPQRQRVTISIHNLSGQWIRTLLDQEKEAGEYELTFDASNLASGTYFCCFAAGPVVETRKMILQK
ncbi:T9SS type A sorting domain-containing protein [candidate division KSB1 bacterium]|nr:T9SS type A sorting domain-containing protein [candidate division KSB1 bacterium]